MIRILEQAFIRAVNHVTTRSTAPATQAVASVLDATHIGQTIPFVHASSSSGNNPVSTPIMVAPSFSSEEVYLPFERRLSHVYLLGATGVGKTNLLLRLLESDIAHGRSVCVVDLRGDLIERVLPRLAAAAPPQEWNERLLFLDLRDREFAIGFNPLAGEGDAYSRALHAFDVIKAQVDVSGVRWEQTLRNTLLALAFGNWTLLEVAPMLNDPAFRVQVLSSVDDEEVIRFWTEQFGRLSPAQKDQHAAEVLNKISPLLITPTMRRVLGQRQAPPLRSLMDKPGQVALVSLAVDRLHGAAHLMGALFVSAFQTAIMARADNPKAPRPPVALYVDEFQTMATERFEDIISEGRRFGLGLALGHQNAHQIETGLLYSLRNIVGTQFYFQTGASDATELAPEVGIGTHGATRAEIISTLVSQKRGQAFLVRRGEPSVRVQVLPCPDPRVSDKQVEELKQVARANFARSVKDIDDELAGRVSARRQIPRARAPVAAPPSAPAPQSAPVSPPSAPPPPTPDPASAQAPNPAPPRRRPLADRLAGAGSPDQISPGDTTATERDTSGQARKKKSDRFQKRDSQEPGDEETSDDK